MMAASVERERWPRARWWLAIALVLVVQVGLVFWLSDHSPIVPRPPTSSPTVYLAVDFPAPGTTLSDPLLFSPANPHGFSGPTWLKSPKPEHHLSDWTVPPSLLTLQVQNLGNAFSGFVRTNATPAFAFADTPTPPVAAPELFLPAAPVMAQSTLRVEGELAERPLITPLALPGCTNTEILSPTVVQVAVDRDGNTVSANLLSTSGLKSADRQALELARAARYESIRGTGTEQLPVASLSWGKLTFSWHTMPPPMTEPTPTKP